MWIAPGRAPCVVLVGLADVEHDGAIGDRRDAARRRCRPRRSRPWRRPAGHGTLPYTKAYRSGRDSRQSASVTDVGRTSGSMSVTERWRRSSHRWRRTTLGFAASLAHVYVEHRRPASCSSLRRWASRPVRRPRHAWGARHLDIDIGASNRMSHGRTSARCGGGPPGTSAAAGPPSRISSQEPALGDRPPLSCCARRGVGAPPGSPCSRSPSSTCRVPSPACSTAARRSSPPRSPDRSTQRRRVVSSARRHRHRTRRRDHPSIRRGQQPGLRRGPRRPRDRLLRLRHHDRRPDPAGVRIDQRDGHDPRAGHDLDDPVRPVGPR